MSYFSYIRQKYYSVNSQILTLSKIRNRCRYLWLMFFYMLCNKNEVSYYLGIHNILSSSIMSFLSLTLAVVFKLFGGSAQQLQLCQLGMHTRVICFLEIIVFLSSNFITTDKQLQFFCSQVEDARGTSLDSRVWLSTSGLASCLSMLFHLQATYTESTSNLSYHSLTFLFF